MISICRKFEFQAAHHLPNYVGACANPHGHSYRLEIEIAREDGGVHPATGMILDFSKLKEVVQEHILSICDHQDLNNRWYLPTAEIMVRDIAALIRKVLDPLILQRVRLYETSNSYAEWRP